MRCVTSKFRLTLIGKKKGVTTTNIILTISKLIKYKALYKNKAYPPQYFSEKINNWVNRSLSILSIFTTKNVFVFDYKILAVY